MQRGAGLVLQIGEGNRVYMLANDQTIGANIDDGEVGIYPVHTGDAGKRQIAVLDNLGGAVPGAMIGEDEDLLGADGQIHRPADGRRAHAVAQIPIGEIAPGRYLERAEGANVDMAAPDHGK